MKKFTWIFLSLIFGLVLSACGPAEEAVEVVPTEAPVVEETSEEMAEEEMESNTIVDIAVNDSRFSTLVTAVTEAGLVETLSSEGPFTVFAPTDDAFAALPEGMLETLLADPDGALTDVLLYHVVQGKVDAATVVGLDTAATAAGENISITVEEGTVFLNGETAVIITDIMADNGIIHVIDSVLIPPSMFAEEEMPTIAEIAVENGSFNTLVAALQAAGLAETFASEGDYTVFAPTDDAFAALPEGTLDSLLADPEGALTQILTYHVVQGSVLAADVIGLDSATTLSGEDISITVDGDTVFLNDTVAVVTTDIQASNGVIHVIDGVLIPPSIAAMEAEVGTIAEVAADAGIFNTLLTALDAAGLADTFASEGSFTVFAPTDDAFAALPEGTLASLLEDPKGALTNILLYHVLQGEVSAETVVTLDSATPLSGEHITISVEDGRVFLNDNVEVITTNIQASNGIIHVIDTVLIPSG